MKVKLESYGSIRAGSHWIKLKKSHVIIRKK